MSVLELQASQIKCGGCVSRIHEALTALPGVASVEVDIASNRVRITGEDPDPVALKARLAELGYPVQA